MATNINRNLPGYAYDAATNNQLTPSSINPFATIADIPLSTGTQLLSGGASWSNTGMVFNVSALTYKINGVLFSSSATSVTLATGDPTYDRFDAIVANTDEVVSVITGVPALNPLVPSIPGDSVLVQYILVSVGATTPNVTNAFVYREGSTPDWLPGVTGVGSGAPTADFSSTTPTPFQGTQCLNATFSIMDWSGRFVRFTAPSPISRSAYVVLSMRVNLPVNYTNLDANVNGRRPVVALMNGNTFLGTIFLDQFGLNRSLINTWQLVTIPLSVFTSAPSLTTITQLRLYSYEYINTVPPSVAIAFDDIKFQSGFGPQSNTATINILDSGTVIGSTAKLNFINGENTTVTVTDDNLNNKIDVKIDNVTNKLGISDANGKYTYYPDFTTALAAATSGQKIKFFTDVTTSLTNFALKNGVDIDLNGHTFETTNSGFLAADRFITDVAGPVTVNIYNGILKRNAGDNVLRILSTSSVINCNNVSIVSTGGAYSVESAGTINNININASFGYSGSGILNNAFVTSPSTGINIAAGGEAYNCTSRTVGGTAISMAGSKLYNCKGYSNNGTGIEVSAGTAIDCTGTTINAAGILGNGGFLINCKGSSSSNYGIQISNANASNCYGYSFNTAGVAVFNTNASTLQDIVGYSILGNGVYLRPNSGTASLYISQISGTTFGISASGILVDTALSRVELYNVTAATSGSAGHGISTIINQPLLIVGGSISVANAASRCIYNVGITNQIKFGNLTFKIPTGTTAISAGIDNSAVVNTPDIYGNLVINS